MIIDLSVLLNEQTPVYPGDPRVQIQAAGVIEQDNFNDHVVTLGNHVGTHIDAPLHMIGGGQKLDDIPVDQFVGEGSLVDAIDGLSLEKIKAAGIESGDIVLIYTGASERYHEASYFSEYPVLSQEMVDYLISKNIKMIGFDTGSADNIDGFPIHKMLLKNGILIIENLTNLVELKNKKFKVYALPLKMDIDGAPARVIAELKENE